MHSLRGKIKFGYFSFALLIGVISLFAYLDLRFVDQQIVQGEVVARLKETVLEMRRYEKNHFLYHDAADLEQALALGTEALRLLHEAPQLFASLSPAHHVRELQQMLQHYRAQLESLRGPTAALPEATIRENGRHISGQVTAMAADERALLRESINQAQRVLLISIAILIVLSIAVGRQLSRAVAEPLRRLEQDLQPIAEGRFDTLRIRSHDQEIVSFAEAINRMLAELEMRRRRLLHSEKLASLGVLVSGVAHELNNPLSNISTSAQLLLEELDSADPRQQREWLGQIDEQTERARKIVRALLDFARDTQFELQPTPLLEVVEKSMLLLRNQLKRRVRMHTEVAPEIIVAGDKHRLQQVFINLIKNAADACDTSLEVTVRAEQTQRSQVILSDHAYIFGNERCGLHDSTPVTRIIVSDNGPGIDPAILPRVFDPFFTTKEVGQGMGLGLYVVMEIIEEHKGCIAVESEQGRGTCFTILLPSEGSPEANL